MDYILLQSHVIAGSICMMLPTEKDVVSSKRRVPLRETRLRLLKAVLAG